MICTLYWKNIAEMQTAADAANPSQTGLGAPSSGREETRGGAATRRYYGRAELISFRVRATFVNKTRAVFLVCRFIFI